MASLEDARPPDIEGRDAALVHLLARVWTYPLTTKSTDARSWADEIAEGASRELLTTAVVPPPTKIYGRIWKITPKGLAFLWDNEKLLTFEEARYVETYARSG